MLFIPVHSQTIQVETKIYNEENGLSRYANYTYKDNRGIIWVGTQYGLYRFDGQDFVHFDEKDGLPFRQIMEIYEDTDGWLWLYRSCHSKPLCERNLAFFHPLSKKTLTFEQRFGDKVSVSPDQIASVAQDSRKNIFMTADRKFLIWTAEQGIKEVPIEGVSETPLLWNKINDQLFGAFIFDNWRGKDANSDLVFNYLAIDQNGKLKQELKTYYLLKTPVTRFYQAGKKVFEFDKIRVSNFEISFSPSGALIVDTLAFHLPFFHTLNEYYHNDGQLFVNETGEMFHRELGGIIALEKSYSQKLGTPLLSPAHSYWVKGSNTDTSYYQVTHGGGNSIRHNFFDYETKTVWMAGREGIKLIRYKPQKFSHLVNPDDGKQLVIAALNIDEQTTILRIEKKIYKYTPQDKLRSILHPIVSKGRAYVPKTFSQEAGDTHFWAFSEKELNKINRDNFSVSETFTPEFKDLSLALLKTGSQVWMADLKEIKIYHIDRDSFSSFTQFNEFGQLASAKVHFFKEIDEVHLWIGTDSGLYLCSKEKGVLARYAENEKGEKYLPASNFKHLSEAREGGYWLATMSGLIQWNLLTQPPSPLKGESQPASISTDGGSSPFRGLGGGEGSWQLFSTNTGLKTNEILAAYEDDYGFVWMPTPHGLIQFQINTGLSKTYLKADGLSSDGFQENAHCQLVDGSLFLGSFFGVNLFHPKDFKDVDLKPEVPLIITDYEQHRDETDKIEYLLEKIKQDQKIVIEPGDKFFNIRVALADYREAEKHRFAYKIEGYHEAWQEDKSNLIRISGLPYGDYVLKIKGRMPDGLLSEPGLAIPVNVLRPIYLQSWFIGFSILLIFLLVFYLYKRRTNALKRKQVELEQAVTAATKTIRQQNEELQKLDKVKSRFFANVSHELRTPITLILGPLNSLLKGGRLNQKDRTFADLGQKNAKNLLTLVNEILDLTKMESGKIELNEEPTEFYPMVQLLKDAFNGIADQKAIDYQLDYRANQNLQLLIDIKKVQKLINNLLSNAFKFTPPNGQIKLSVAENENHIQLSVQDSGRGIHPDDVPHVFDRFYQSSQPDAPKEGGTGIGLSLCMEFAKLMNGKLWVESILGKGSTFYFDFPKQKAIGTVDGGRLTVDGQAFIEEPNLVQEKHTIHGEEIPSPDSYRDHLQPSTILLVEDNDNLREYIQLIIGEKHEVVAAENGKVAWEYLTVDGGQWTVDGENRTDPPPSTVHRLPDLIISDIMMPEMDGYQLLEKLKGSDQFRGIPVIMLTALAELKDKLKALRIGVDDYMTKPFEEEELLARLDNLLRHSYWRKQYRIENREEDGSLDKDSGNIETIEASNSITEEDSIWLEKLEATILDNLGRFDFSIEQLAHELAASRWTLYRRIKQLTGLTATQYLQEVRLNHARTLLEQQQPNSVKALSYNIGIKNVRYFSVQFKKRFGKLPSEYL